MLAGVPILRSWRHVAFITALIAALALISGQASAQVAGSGSGAPSGPVHDSAPATRDSGLFAGKPAPNAPLSDAFLLLTPGTGGTVPAPANGGSVPVGGRFVFDLMLNSG